MADPDEPRHAAVAPDQMGNLAATPMPTGSTRAVQSSIGASMEWTAQVGRDTPIVLRPDAAGLVITGASPEVTTTLLEPLTIEAHAEVIDTPEAKRHRLQANLLLLQAAIAAPKSSTSIPIGPGHNRGPDLASTTDEVEINSLIALLKAERISTIREREEIIEAAKSLEKKADAGMSLLQTVAVGIVTGAATELGKELIQAPWWSAVYAWLKAVCVTAIDWVMSLPPLS